MGHRTLTPSTQNRGSCAPSQSDTFGAVALTQNTSALSPKTHTPLSLAPRHPPPSSYGAQPQTPRQGVLLSPRVGWLEGRAAISSSLTKLLVGTGSTVLTRVKRGLAFRRCTLAQHSRLSRRSRGSASHVMRLACTRTTSTSGSLHYRLPVTG